MTTHSVPAPILPAQSSFGNHARLTIVAVASLAVIFIAGHLPLMRETLDGIDSTNFVLAVDGYDPRLHQPHPPGFPVHVALGRVVTAAYRAIFSADEIGTAATSLRLWSALSGSLTVVAMMWVALGVGLSRWRSAIATALLTVCPLFWMTAMRPLSDVPGLLFAMLSQALLFAASTAGASRQSWWLAAAFAAGIAAGVRVQTMLLTLPLLALLAALHLRRSGVRPIALIVVAFVVGVLVWAVPLVISLGGPQEYVRLLTTVAADDVDGVELLATDFTPRLIALALTRTFLVPWGSILIGAVVIVAALAGAMNLIRHERRVLGLLAVMGAPYAAFHLLFQETASIRYALPLVPVVAMLIAGAVQVRRRWVWGSIVVALVIASATTSLSAAMAYAQSESPVARATEDAMHEARRLPLTRVFAAHHAVGRAIRAEHWPGSTLASPVRYEWLQLARYWLDGGRDPVWFFADHRRTDLALVDGAARRVIRAYEWPKQAATLLGGIQPPQVAWYEIALPGWFLMRGWALTPEVHGVSTRDRQGPGYEGALGYVRRRNLPAAMFIGGRNLGGPCDTAASIEVLIDGQQRASWTVPARASFLQRVALASGALAGNGDYAEVNVIARDVTGAERVVDVALEQFDVQSADTPMIGFDRGWHMPEHDTATSMTWRWTEDVAQIRLETFGRDVELSIRGESPLRYFQDPPRVVVQVGQTTVASFRPTDDFTWTGKISAAALASAEGRVVIETDRSFIPDEVSGNGDRRRLSLRIFEVSVAALASSGRPN